MSAPHDDPRVEVRLYGDLAWFVAAADRSGRASVPLGGRRSVKDLLESIGLPHVEVGGLLVDGDPARLDDLASPGSRLSVYPPLEDLAPPVATWPSPPDPRRFVADVHLGTLARRIRLLGFDTWYRTDADDPELADVASTQQRVLLTRDRGLLMRREVVHGYCPRSSDPDQQLREVSARYGLATRAAPYTRCAECNGQLVDVGVEDVRDRIPRRTAEEHDRFRTCPDCERVYWPGSHLDDLAARHPDLFDRGP